MFHVDMTVKRGEATPKYFGLDNQTTKLGLLQIGHFLTMVVNFKKYTTIIIATGESFWDNVDIVPADMKVKRGESMPKYFGLDVQTTELGFC